MNVVGGCHSAGGQHIKKSETRFFSTMDDKNEEKKKIYVVWSQGALIINQHDSTIGPKISKFFIWEYNSRILGNLVHCTVIISWTATYNLVEWAYGWFKHPFHGWLKHPFQGCTNQVHTFTMHDSTRQRRMGCTYNHNMTYNRTVNGTGSDLEGSGPWQVMHIKN